MEKQDLEHRLEALAGEVVSEEPSAAAVLLSLAAALANGRERDLARHVQMWTRQALEDLRAGR